MLLFLKIVFVFQKTSFKKVKGIPENVQNLQWLSNKNMMVSYTEGYIKYVVFLGETTLPKKILSDKNDKILVRWWRFSLTKHLLDKYFTRWIFLLDKYYQIIKISGGKGLKFPYFPPWTTQLKYQMTTMLPVSVARQQGSYCRKKIIFWL